MIRLLRWLIWGDWHKHSWKVIGHHENVCCYGKGTRYYLQCSVCGDTKVKNPWA